MRVAAAITSRRLATMIHPDSPALTVCERLIEYSQEEFSLDLPDHWRRCASMDDDALHWHSPTEDASVAVSIEFQGMVTETAAQTAQACLDARDAVILARSRGQADIFQRSAKAQDGGAYLEIIHATQLPEQTCVYLGYVTPRKVFNFVLTCTPERREAAALFEKFARERLRVKVP